MAQQRRATPGCVNIDGHHYIFTPSGPNGVYVDHSGARYEGQWRDGQPHGEGTLYHISGVVCSGVWSAGTLTRGTIRYVDGSYYEGTLEQGKMHGEGIFVDAAGTRWFGSFVQGEGVDLECEMIL
ncbi:MORN repeat, putative [Angomonas deanei]|uniref:MORN repeat, putative n=1 Tax=Angomonas deanei TaxID=59799 RepID=A0A7G2CRC5_9TRYP|nr:MORN repeat, putative [Angomonas deanei]